MKKSKPSVSLKTKKIPKISKISLPGIMMATSMPMATKKMPKVAKVTKGKKGGK